MYNEDHRFIQSLEQQWTCSISKTLMQDPVVTADGQTYDRESITHWLLNDNRSPNTGLELTSTDLIPNIAFKNLFQKLTAELPGFIAKEEGLMTYIEQLKEEIDYLKVELQHEKQKNDEHIEKQEREFKTKKIEKSRHQDKNIQLKVIRDQKNAFQKELQELRTKDQQQNRQIRLLKQELSSFKQKYSEASGEKKRFEQLYKKMQCNRFDFIHKIRISFSSNLVFIGHLLQAIEDARKVESQLNQRQKGTQETIAVPVQNVQETPRVNQNQSMLENQPNIVPSLVGGQIIKRLEEIIRERINGLRREQEQEQEDGEIEQNPLHRHRRAMIRRRIIERRLRARGIDLGPLRRPIQDGTHDQEGSMPVEQLFSQISNQMREQIPQPQTDPTDPTVVVRPVSQDTGLYRQLQSIKWLMTKRNYRQLPLFYDYQFIKQHTDLDVMWYGVRLRVLESRIPFVEYLNHSWNHVRILDLSACNVDDELWQKFLQSAKTNFRGLSLINLDRNGITTVKASDLHMFFNLKQISINRNKLTKESKDELNKYISEHPQVKVQFRFNDGEEGSDLDFFELQ